MQCFPWQLPHCPLLLQPFPRKLLVSFMLSSQILPPPSAFFEGFVGFCIGVHEHFHRTFPFSPSQVYSAVGKGPVLEGLISAGAQQLGGIKEMTSSYCSHSRKAVIAIFFNMCFCLYFSAFLPILGGTWKMVCGVCVGIFVCTVNLCGFAIVLWRVRLGEAGLGIKSPA